MKRQQHNIGSIESNRMHAPDESVSGYLAQWASGLSPDDIPATVRTRAKTCLVDTIGSPSPARKATLRCSHERSVPRAAREDRPPRSARPGFLSAQAAAFSNGTAAHAFDFDDNCYAGSCTVRPSLRRRRWPLARKINASSADVITAFVVGSECEYALGAASKNALYERGWWTTGVLGPDRGVHGRRPSVAPSMPRKPARLSGWPSPAPAA